MKVLKGYSQREFRLVQNWQSIRRLLLFITLASLFVLSNACNKIIKEENQNSSLDIVEGENVSLRDPVRVHTVMLLIESIGETQNEKRFSSCTGTLISRYHVLTAAHCVYDSIDIDVIFEANQWTEKKSSMYIKAKGYEAHPDYDHVKIFNDIGVVELSKPAPPHYSPARIGSQAKLFPAQPVIMTGYGLSSYKDSGDIDLPLRRAETTINRLSSSWGIFSYERPNTIITDGSLIFKKPQLCSGDSGGPLFLDELPGPRLVGVASFSDLKCQRVSGYTNIFPYWKWVMSVVERDPDALKSAVFLPKKSTLTRETSDEYELMSPALCQGGSIAVGFQCSGRYCDNIGLTCAGATDQRINVGVWSEFFSEEESNTHICQLGEAVTGIRCKGAFCDNISVRCSKIQNLAANSCQWSRSVSEEKGGRLELELGEYIAGLQCEGRYCDSKKAYVCRSDDKWTAYTSDEKGKDSPAVCDDGEIVRGFSCRGKYCDDLAVKCSYEPSTVLDDPDANWSSYFSEERKSAYVCDNDGFISGVRCEGSYCDSVSVRCTEIDGVVHQGCFWTGYFSEEQGGRMDIPDGFGAAGLRCEGRYCDHKQLYICPTNIRFGG